MAAQPHATTAEDHVSDRETEATGPDDPGADGSPTNGGNDDASSDPPVPPNTAMVQSAGAKGAKRPSPPRRTGVFIDVEDLRSHVSDLLRTIVGEHAVDPWGNYSFDHGSTRVFVAVRGGPIGPVVGIFSVLVTDAELTEALATWMASTNHRLLFGALSWDESNDAVWLRHNLLGSHLDAPELGAAVQAVASTAGMLDDQITSRFGGVRFVDGPGHPGNGKDDQDDEPQAARPGQVDELRPPNASGYL